MFEVGRRFLRQTKRVVSVKFYVDQLFYDNGVITHIQAFKEFSNPNNRFDPSRDWDMFKTTTAGGPVPEIWRRLINFPNDPGRVETFSFPTQPSAMGLDAAV